MRGRASAGTGSFRWEDKLKDYLEEARARVRALKREVDEDPGALTRRQARVSVRFASARSALRRRWRGCRNWARSSGVKARKPRKRVLRAPTRMQR